MKVQVETPEALLELQTGALFDEPDAVIVGVTLATGLSKVSFSVTVIVGVATPFATGVPLTTIEE